MLKRGISGLLMISVLALGVLSGCDAKEQGGNQQTSVENGVTEDLIFEHCGIKLTIPKEYQDQGLTAQEYGVFPEPENAELSYAALEIAYGYRPELEAINAELTEDAEYTEEMATRIKSVYDTYWKTFAQITLLPEEDYNDYVSRKADMAAMFGINGSAVDEFARNGGYVYLITEPENDSEGMSEEAKAGYETALANYPAVLESIEYTEVKDIADQAAAGDVMPAFSAKDTKGNLVTNEIFSQKDLTVVNVWGTFCSPCIEEMPELGEWAKEMPENVQLIGIVGDVYGEGAGELLKDAQSIIEKAGVEFVNIVPDEALNEWLEGIVAYPTTVFVDREGNLVSEPISGAYVEEYKEAVEEYLSANK